MTNWTAAHERVSGMRAFAERIRNAQQRISDRAHAAGDQHARAHGWTVTENTGRFGMGARTYRDPRFGTRQLAGSGNTTAPGRSVWHEH